MKKNVAGQYLSVAMINATTGAALTGATVACRRNLDGSDAAVTGSITEPNSDGKYLLALSQADTNGDNCSYYFTASGGIPACVNVHTDYPQTGDAYGIVTDGTYGNSAIETLVDDLESRLTAARAGYLDNLSGGAVALASGVAVTSIGNDAITAAAIATNAIDADALAADAITEIQAGLSTLSAAQVNAEVVDALTVDVIADSVATDGSRPTIAQAVLMLTRFLMERSVSSTTMIVKKEDGTTANMTFTLDSATAPTAISRTS